MFEYVQNFVNEEEMLISHLNWVVVLVDLNSKSTIDMLIILITFDMIKIVIVNLVKLLLKMLKMMFASTFRKW